MGKLKIGIIGCGYMAQMAHLVCLSANKDVEIVALCDFREKVTAELCRKWNIPRRTTSVAELLTMDIDAVYVLTPVQWHLNNIEAALKAGKHVFTEKPAAMSVASIARLEQAAAVACKTVMVGYMKRHEANIGALKKIRAQSDWGKLLFIRTHSFIGSHWNAAINDLVPVISSDEVLHFEASLLDPSPAWLKAERNQSFYSFENPYYGLLDTGCHSVNLLRYLTDKTPTVKAVKGGRVRLVDFDFDGTPGVMEFCINFAMHRWDEITELYFEKASVTIKTPPPLDIQTSAEVEVYSEDGALHRNLKIEDNRQWAFRLQAEAFIATVQSGKVSSDLEDARKDVSIIEDIFRMETKI